MTYIAAKSVTWRHGTAMLAFNRIEGWITKVVSYTIQRIDWNTQNTKQHEPHEMSGHTALL